MRQIKWFLGFILLCLLTAYGKCAHADTICVGYNPCTNISLKGITLTISSNATIGGTLVVTGAQTFTGNTTMSGNATVGGTFGVTGATTVTSLSATGAVTTSSTFAGVYTLGDTTTPTLYPGFQYTTNYTPTTVGTGTVPAIYGLVNRLGSQTIANPGHLVGVLGHVVNNATGTTTDLVIGTEGKHTNTAGTITNGIGALGVLTSNGGTYTTWAGHYSQITANAGTITNGFGYGLTVASAGTLTNFIGYDYPSISGGATIGTALAFRNNDTAANQQFFGRTGYGVAPVAGSIVKIDNVATGVDPLDVFVGGVQGFSVGLDGGMYGFSHVEANTATKVPTLAESNETYTNTGDADGSQITLTNDPGANNTYQVCVTVAQTVTIVPSAGETLNMAGSACGTSITSNTVGSCIRITAVVSGSGGKWYTSYSSGTWVCNA